MSNAKLGLINAFYSYYYLNFNVSQIFSY